MLKKYQIKKINNNSDNKSEYRLAEYKATDTKTELDNHDFVSCIISRNGLFYRNHVANKLDSSSWYVNTIKLNNNQIYQFDAGNMLVNLSDAAQKSDINIRAGYIAASNTVGEISKLLTDLILDNKIEVNSILLYIQNISNPNENGILELNRNGRLAINVNSDNNSEADWNRQIADTIIYLMNHQKILITEYVAEKKAE